MLRYYLQEDIIGIGSKSNGQPAFSLQFKGDNVLLDIIDTSFFDFADDDDNIGLFSKLKTAKNLHNSLMTTA
jgi:hypothetical protein